MINKFDYYLKNGKVRRKTPDPIEAKSLFIKSKERLEYIKKEINETTAKFVLEDTYDTIRESTQSLMSLSGFKPYSHEATISFLKEFYKDNFSEEEIIKFDRFRELRNNSVYKAIEISVSDAESCLCFATMFINKIKNLIDKLENPTKEETKR